jgi:hypothetical protein
LCAVVADGSLSADSFRAGRMLVTAAPACTEVAIWATKKANDVITHLDDEATQGMTVNQALDKMRGPVNTQIRLRIVRKGENEPIELTIVRGVIRPQGAGSDLQVGVEDGKLQIETSGVLPLLDFEKGSPITVVPMSSNQFFVDGGDHTRLTFLRDEAGKSMDLVLNPGPLQITGRRIS